MDSQFVAALAGAGVGGAASLAGSVLVNRWELKRSARLRLHDELLPQLAVDLERMPFGDFGPTLEATKRAAVLAGRGARDRTDAVVTAHERWLAMFHSNGSGTLDGVPTDPPEQQAAFEQVRHRIADFAAWTEHKLRLL